MPSFEENRLLELKSTGLLLEGGALINLWQSVTIIFIVSFLLSRLLHLPYGVEIFPKRTAKASLDTFKSLIFGDVMRDYTPPV